MEVLTLTIWKTSTVHDATPDAGFGRPDLTVFCRLDELGLVVTGQRLDPERAVLAAGSSTPTTGATAAAARASRAAPSSAGWRTSRSGGDPPACT